MEDLILYFCAPLRLQELGLQEAEIETGTTIIAVAVPLMVLTAVLGFLCFALLSVFNFVRGRKRDI